MSDTRSPGGAALRARRNRRLASVHDVAEVTPGWRVTPVGNGPRNTTYENWIGRRLRYTGLTGGGIAYTRDEADLNDEYGHLLQLGILHSGRVTVTREGRTMIGEAGTVIVLRLDTPYETITDPGSALTLIYVPIDQIETRGIDTRRMNGQIWQAGPIEATIAELAPRALDVDEQNGLILEGGLFELVIGLLAAHDEAAVEDVAAQTRNRVLAIIEESYTQVDLDAATIARRLGVSRRYLYTLFEGRDASVAALIRNRRVTHAEKLLIDDTDLSLRRVAQLSGLGSEDRLLRTFKTVLGMSPSAYRRQTHIVGGEAILAREVR
jgi:AraC-like DNA-binding protein